MKNQIKIYVALLFLVLLMPGFAQDITFGGGNVIVTQNTEIHIPGKVSVIAETNLQNNGEIFVGGDWQNLSPLELEMQNGTGTVIFNGLSNQTIGGNDRTYFSHVYIQSHVLLAMDTRIYGGLQLSQSILTLNNHNLHIMPGAEISGAGEYAYIDASSAGFLIQQVANQGVLFPVGNTNNYFPALIQNQGIVDKYGIQVFDDVLSEGISGNTIPEVEDCVINTWHVIEQAPGGSLLDLTLQWDELAEGADFTRSFSAIGHFKDEDWVPEDPTNATGTGPWQQSLSGITETGAFAVGDPESPMAVTIQYDEQEITITEGWSGISSYLYPLNPEFDVIFSDVIDEIGIVQDLFNFYWPSQGINTLGNWDSYSGYQIKMSGEVTINFAGTPLVNTKLNLDAGWNLFPILVSCRTTPEDLFEGTSAVLVREVAATGLYWPEFNINTLGLLAPGNAYMAYMDSAEDVEFPGCNKADDFDGPGHMVAEPVTDPRTQAEIIQTNVQHTFALPAMVFESAGIEPGEHVLAISEQDQCFGSLQWTGANASMVLFGDDLTTPIKDGFSQGEHVYFKHWNPTTNLALPLTPVFENRFNADDGKFVNNAISVISGFKSSEIALSERSDCLIIFPNPTKESIRIQGKFENAKIRILDMNGFERINTQIESSENNVNVNSLTPGIYIVEVLVNGKLMRKRLIKK